MNILNFLLNYIKGFNKKTASKAKERLQIVISHERATESSPEFINKLRQEIVEVIGKYVDIDADSINVQLQQEGKNSVLELNVTIPDEKKTTVKPVSLAAAKSKTNSKKKAKGTKVSVADSV